MATTRSSGQYCPIARAADVFAERWTPIIVRNLHVGAETFSEIRSGAPGIPKSLLSARLQKLECHGIVARRAKERGRGWRYALTPKGEELWEVCHALGVWGARWLEMQPDDFDPYMVLWVMARRLRWETVPQQRIVVAFEFVDQPSRHRYFWLRLERPEAEVCVTDPGSDNELSVRAEGRAFVEWHVGALSWHDAIDDGRISITGLAPLVRAFPHWNPGSHFADVAPVHPSTR